jgi:hypothetical protein
MRTYPLQNVENLENLGDVSNYQKLVAEITIGLFFKRKIVQKKYIERLEGFRYLQKIKAINDSWSPEYKNYSFITIFFLLIVI